MPSDGITFLLASLNKSSFLSIVSHFTVKVHTDSVFLASSVDALIFSSVLSAEISVVSAISLLVISISISSFCTFNIGSASSFFIVYSVAVVSSVDRVLSTNSASKGRRVSSALLLSVFPTNIIDNMSARNKTNKTKIFLK